MGSDGFGSRPAIFYIAAGKQLKQKWSNFHEASFRPPADGARLVRRTSGSLTKHSTNMEDHSCQKGNSGSRRILWETSECRPRRSIWHKLSGRLTTFLSVAGGLAGHFS